MAGFNWIDIVVFSGFFAVVIGVSLFKSRKENSGEDYFLAGRSLTWWLIGFSLIAANISTEQFVGMSGSSAGNVGFAIASYEWISVPTLVFVALFFLPKLLRSGIYTFPEFLEYRYNPLARGIMALYMMIIYVSVTIVAVLWSGALTLSKIFDLPLWAGIILIGGIAMIYATYGGLKAVAWADLFQGSGLILGGLCVTAIGIAKLGGIQAFLHNTPEKFHLILPASHPELPWTALVGGLWIPALYYWGLNQFICQKTLGAKSLKEGQRGIIFAAGLKIILPLITVLPGIIAFQLYGRQLAQSTPDAAFPTLIRNLIPVGLKGFIFAALAGAVISTLGAMLNSASTILTIDLYKRYLNKSVSSRSLVKIGRLLTVVFLIVSGLIALSMKNPKGIFHFIQEFQGFISPGILAAFLFGLLFKRTPPAAGVAALILNPVVYGALYFGAADNIAFLNRMLITFGVIIAVMAVLTIARPLKEPVVLPVKADVATTTDPSIVWMGAAAIVVTVVLYIILR
jgi:solute:Na+ symporter, SSS family